ncbi:MULTISPECIES: ABC transporter ATP-binding protein [unclassified Clostridioides]|uniref:ABC transporter ATP-binding protein n=1 Tax=unclassified Clostridioides TaxID=2635829 RepID=UPI001D0C6D31|nr:ABC transporter ATP-binding protein [Clostridioides sp. ES-S-0001-02]MCC0641661.1 ABC transporter ATP-binding protein [Clostridioides sp. ES-S-0049-03]MCC0653177.1 ABC transporter ATP-binding protein [Clostridioides sp. ES-S-0001-03]MCC0656816.1 ABC transporter ATP-binding protein [Clostridioides sp. ES-S-0123-01]MCC0673452.1 ABC transporter ATP-binding protein [Clostridioides sp. ES-S-0145-01]MCC0676194.1 ABC transporter ATP-binding protein [Clostridioides sp. ES-W-0018-02]MCC0681526.1 AB
MIEIRNVTKKMGNNVILDDISLAVETGTLVVLIGSSGCGKTTTLKLINKLIKPTSGEIYINGKPISQENEIELRRKIGYVIQNTGLFPHLTIKENIELIPRLKKEKSVEEIEARTLQLLEMVGLDSDDFLNKYPSELSGGQQQRIGVARAIATDAEIILMDEPFSALDPITRTSLQEQLFSLQDELKKTIIFVTHDMDEALKIADKICIMKDGRIAQYDTPENILRNPANDFVKDFIGEDRVWDNPEYIKAKDIMIKNPIAVNSTRTVTQGIEIMRTSKVDSLLIIDRARTLKGIVTVKDMKDRHDKSTLLGDIMSREPLHVNEGDNLVEILNIMNCNSVGYIPVVSSENKLVGLITRSSLLSVLSEQFLEMEVSVLG